MTLVSCSVSLIRDFKLPTLIELVYNSRPKSFYTETLVTPDRRERIRFGSDDGTSHPPRRNRWGPDLPNSDGKVVITYGAVVGWMYIVFNV